VPVLTFHQILEHKLLETRDLKRLRDEGLLTGMMYVPLDAPGDEVSVDEWTGHGAALLYCMTAVRQELLTTRTRVARLTSDGTRLFQAALINLLTGLIVDPFESLREPDMSDSWATPK
jgi:hypothetical protein